jgi:hypothetical protein
MILPIIGGYLYLIFLNQENINDVIICSCIILGIFILLIIILKSIKKNRLIIDRNIVIFTEKNYNDFIAIFKKILLNNGFYENKNVLEKNNILITFDKKYIQKDFNNEKKYVLINNNLGEIMDNKNVLIFKYDDETKKMICTNKNPYLYNKAYIYIKEYFNYIDRNVL